MPRRLFLVVAFLALAISVGCTVAWYTTRETLPPEIRVAAGKQDGLYHTFAQQFAKRLHERTGRPVRVIETNGSEENLRLLRDGEVDLALIQTVSLTPEGVVGIAPLFPEPMYFIARKDKGIDSLAKLTNRKVALGLSGSSMRQNSHTVLAHYNIATKPEQDAGQHFGELATDPDLDAALVTTGWMNPILEKLLRRSDVQLVGIPDPEGLAMRHPWFTPTTIPRGLYPGSEPAPAEPVRTVAVTALLASRSDASDELVRESLGAIYETDLRASFPGLLTAKAAKDYDAAVMHPGAAKYHDPAVGFKRISQAMELLSKSKEALFGVVTFCLLVWGWVRRHRERTAAAADEAQRKKLDDFIGQTLAVELEQMDVTDPEELRPYLRRVTHIKQEALRELTSEKVRGDQLFAIFLSQCAALSEKIQMRMMYGRLSEANAELKESG